MKINKYNTSKEGGSEARQAQSGLLISSISNNNAEVTDEAQRLKETHLIFGQPFNGSQDVSGDISNAQNITTSGGDLTILQETDDEGVNGGNILADGHISAGGNVSGTKFIGDVEADLVSASEGDIALINANNINVEGVVTIEDKLRLKDVDIYKDDEGTKFEGDVNYWFDGSVNAVEVYADNMQTEYISATNADVLDTLDTNNLKGVLAEIKKIISEDIEVDNLTVKKAAHFFKLIIDEIKSVGGQLIISPANASIDKVVMSGSDYKCYFRAEEDDKKIDNQFVVDDQVVCQTFNAAEGVTYNASNKFYWRKVVGVGSEEVDGIKYHYITLSDSDKDIDCNGVPEAGDKVALLGNRSDTSRQNAIIISAYSATFLDSGINPPFIVQYNGISNFNLSTHRNSVISNGMNQFKGDFFLTSGDSVSGLMSEIKSTANDISMLVQEPTQVNIFEGSDGYNYGCWTTYGTCSLSKKYNADDVLVLGGSSGGYILQPSKYYIKTNKLKVSLSTSELQGLASYYKIELVNKSGTSISNRFNLISGNGSYNFTLNSIPNDIVYLKISLIANSRCAFRNEVAYIESVPSRISSIEVDVDSITSRVATAEGDIAEVTQKADGLTSRVTSAEGNISQIQQTTNSITSRVTSVEGNVSQLSQKANELSSKISTAEGNISQIIQNTTQITNRISNVEGNLSQVSQQADRIESEVSKIQVGGKNLINDSEFSTYSNSKNTTWTKKNATASTSYGYMNQIGIHAISNPTNSGTYQYLDIAQQLLKYKLKAGTNYTFSFYAKGLSGTGTDNGTSFSYKGSVTTYVYPNVGAEIADNAHYFTLSDEWERYSYTFKTKDDLDESGTYNYLFRLGSSVENGVRYYSGAYICMPKLEEGTMATDWNTTDDDMKSYITQTADGIESKIMTEETINSKISQSKNNIKAEVYDELNESTGIDIATGTITLNADKTIINGNINVRNADEGLVVYDDDGNASVVIQNKKIPTLSNLDQPSYEFIIVTDFTTNVEDDESFAYFTSAYQKLGKAKAGDNISISYGRFLFGQKVSNTSFNFIPLNDTSFLEYWYVLKNTTTGKLTYSATKTLTANATDWEGVGIEGATFNVTEEGDYEVMLDITYYCPAIYPSYYLQWEFYLDKLISQYTQIGTDGLVSVQDQYKYLYFGKDGFEARMTYYNGFRVAKYKCQQVLADDGDNALWGSLAHRIEVAVNPKTVSMEVIAKGTSQGTKNVVRADGDFYGADMFVFKDLSSEVWVKLPTALISQNNTNYYMGVGRVIKIRNLTSQKCYVYISDSGYKLYDASGTSNASYLSIGSGSAEFVWDGFEWIRTK